MERKLVAIGGGKIPKWSFTTKDDKEIEYETKEIDQEIVRLSGKVKPRFLFIGTASRDNETYYEAIKEIYEGLGAVVQQLSLEEFNEMHETKEEFINRIREIILSADIIYIGGGNTAKMMRIFKRSKVNEYLKLAYERGIILTGLSAGAMAYFTNGYSDSNRSTNPEASLTLVKCLNIITYCFCPHYNEEERKSFDEFVANKHFNGLALEDNTALVYIDDQIKGIIKSDDNYDGYFISENQKIKIDVI